MNTMQKVMYQTRKLIKDIKKTSEYEEYQASKKALIQCSEVYGRLNEFRMKNFKLQMCETYEGLFNDMEKLQQEYKDILVMPVVVEFLSTEQKFCKLMQKVYSSMANDLEFDLDFFKED